MPIFLLSTLLSTLFLGIFYFLYRTKIRLNRTIVQQNEEISKNMSQITTLNKDLNSKNELLTKKNQEVVLLNKRLSLKNEIQEKEIVDFITFKNRQDQQLKNLKLHINEFSNIVPQQNKNWEDIQLNIKTLTDNGDEWLNFKQKIEVLYPDFFQILSLKHPKLNKREQKHCAYILMGMTTKQVADSLFVSSKTVEMARYRIKKKIGLNKTENMSSYIKNYVKF